MGLTYRSTKREALQDLFAIDKTEDQFVIALTGNPNTGKSTVFNALTGLHQHTGNWPGKTVTNAGENLKRRSMITCLLIYLEPTLYSPHRKKS